MKRDLFFLIILVVTNLLFQGNSVGYICSALFSFTYFIQRFRKEGLRNVDPIMLYAISITLIGIANAVGVSSLGSTDEFVYFLYADPQYIPEASTIFLLGSATTIMGFSWGKRFHWFPKLKNFTSGKIVNSLFFISILVIFFKNDISELGAVSALIKSIPLFSIFFLSRYAIANQKNKLILFAITLVIILTIDAVLNSFLRSEMIKPVIFFFLGYVIGKDSIRSLLKLKFVPIYIFIAVFLTYFGTFGDTRSKLGRGISRIDRLVEAKEELEEERDVVGSTPLARMTDFNQVTRVVELSEREGFYKGKTLEYLGFVFIPRFIWPDKPLVQQIGRAHV
mgnify:CR=1 FL=1